MDNRPETNHPEEEQEIPENLREAAYIVAVALARKFGLPEPDRIPPHVPLPPLELFPPR